MGSRQAKLSSMFEPRFSIKKQEYFMPVFPVGSVGHNLMQMRGVWHDHVEIFDLAGKPLEDDPLSGTPGAAPFDNLVYIDFDGIK